MHCSENRARAACEKTVRALPIGALSGSALSGSVPSGSSRAGCGNALRSVATDVLSSDYRISHAVPQGQRGLSLLSVMLILSVAIFLGLFAFKLAPNYLENWTVSKIATDVASNAELLKQPRSNVYSYIGQAYRTNNLWDLEPENTIKLKKDGDRGYIVTIQYEKRDNLFSNIDVVTSFDREVIVAP